MINFKEQRQLHESFDYILDEYVEKVQYGTRAVISDLTSILAKYEYAFIGGLAVSLHTQTQRPVSPKDVDLKILKSESGKIVTDLEKGKFDFHGSTNLYGSTWLQFEKGKQEIDVGLATMPWEVSSIKNAMNFKFEGKIIKVITIPYLMLYKLYADREKDIKDIVMLIKFMNGSKLTLTRKLIDKYLNDKLEDFDQYVELSKLGISM